ncbi:DNA damage-binding protein 1a [Thoreauomyces humboldtii]|nr:DNA damage-binding protein 1a [Thoreauomyces humboldtii]
MGPNLYVVSARKPDSVSHAVKASFTGPDDINVIVSKTTHLEVFILEPTGADDGEQYLRLVLDAPIYDRITTLGKCRLPGKTQDSIIISTERHKFLIVSYNSRTHHLETEIVDDIREPAARVSNFGYMGMVHADGNLVGIHSYEGILKVVDLGRQFKAGKNAKKSTREPRRSLTAVTLRLEERSVIAMQFMESDGSGDQKPMLALVYQDHKKQQNLKVYELDLVARELSENKDIVLQNLDLPKLLIPIPRVSGGGVVVICEQVIHASTYKGSASTPIKPTIMKSWTRLDPEGTRYLLGDYEGKVYVLYLEFKNDALVNLTVQNMGQASQSTALAYLDSGYLYVGSHYGDSQLVHLRLKHNENYQYLDVVMEFENLAPITDFCIVDIEKQGQGQVVACCGAGNDGSLRVIRNGIGIEVLGTLNDVPDINGIWSLRSSFAAKTDDTLVLSFMTETKLQGKDLDGSLGPIDPADAGGFILDQPTLACATVPFDRIVQVTATTVMLLNSRTRGIVKTWNISDPQSQIQHASINPSQLVLAITGGRMKYFELTEHDGLIEKSEITLEHEVSCLDISPFQSKSSDSSSFCLVGLWTDMSIRLLELPSLREMDKQVLDEEMIPRSVLMVTLGGIDFAMAALGDGHLFTFHCDLHTGKFGERQNASLGSHAVGLRTFQSGGEMCVFAASDRPTVLHMSNSKLRFSPVNLKDVAYMCPFNYDGDALALVSDGSLKIGTVETIQKLHIKRIPIGETVRRIAHQERTGTFALLTIRLLQDKKTHEEEERGIVKLLDNQTYEVLDEAVLGPFEMVQSLQSVMFDGADKEYYCVGTAIVVPHELEPEKGRILVFEITVDRKLRLMYEHAASGCPYVLNTVRGRLVAGINSKVHIFRWEKQEGSQTFALIETATHRGNIIVLNLAVRGDFIVIGDLEKSVSVLTYDPETESLSLVARDPDSKWMRALEALDDDLYIGAEHNQYLFALKRQSDAPNDDDRRRLMPFGFYHLGEGVNQLRLGSFSSSVASQDDAKAKAVLVYCTVSGGLGIVATVDDATFTILSHVQDNMRTIVKGVGELRHDSWRDVMDTRGRLVPSKGFLDGDLIEQYLDLSKEQKDAVVRGSKSGGDASQQQNHQHDSKRMKKLNVTVEDLTRIIEEMSRLH